MKINTTAKFKAIDTGKYLTNLYASIDASVPTTLANFENNAHCEVKM